jgi:hypothetical protein
MKIAEGVRSEWFGCCKRFLGAVDRVKLSVCCIPDVAIGPAHRAGPVSSSGLLLLQLWKTNSNSA